MSYKKKIIRAVPGWKHLLKKDTPFVRQQLVSGGAAGLIAVSKIKEDDELVGVIESEASTAVLTDRTDEFSVAKDGYITNEGGTSTASDKLLVTWIAWSI